MDSNSNSRQSYQLQQHPPNSGLLRFRSAPTTLLANKSNNAWEGSESDRLALRFLNSSGDTNDMALPSSREFEDRPSKARNESSTPSHMNSQQQGYSGLPFHYQRHSSAASSAMDSSYGLVGSMGMDHKAHPNSFRRSSFPAGHFSNNISFQNGYDTMKVVGNYGGLNGNDSELSPAMNRLKNQISFSSRSPSSLGMLSQISKTGSEGIGATSPDDGRQRGSKVEAPYYGHGFGSWNDSSNLSENISGLKRQWSSMNERLFSDTQNIELGNQVHILSHHLSLPNTSAEMVAMENLIQFPDSVPCKVRAKRGCATHPRSIAERVRRSRISERIRKLQELVPNMDKQTNTSDMLDLAVGYIKDLQKQFEVLSEKRANCKCISTQKSETNQIA